MSCMGCRWNKECSSVCEANDAWRCKVGKYNVANNSDMLDRCEVYDCDCYRCQLKHVTGEFKEEHERCNWDEALCDECTAGIDPSNPMRAVCMLGTDGALYEYPDELTCVDNCSCLCWDCKDRKDILRRED
ncbi:hypothetical protein AGMMS49543_20830 [Betaproteobacteria bacterium]|nr:hypothetical protein AGMMS49543_20830 [Betaproteobacteria bacterium]